MKRQFAINDFARTKKALDTCPFCYQDDRQPLTAIVALGERTYLCCTQKEELVPGHCLIVPLQHHLSTLEMEDDDWEEVKVGKGGSKGMALTAELHEVPDEDARQGQQGRVILRDQRVLPSTTTHIYRMCAGAVCAVPGRASVLSRASISTRHGVADDRNRSWPPSLNGASTRS